MNNAVSCCRGVSEIGSVWPCFDGKATSASLLTLQRQEKRFIPFSQMLRGHESCAERLFLTEKPRQQSLSALHFL